MQINAVKLPWDIVYADNYMIILLYQYYMNIVTLLHCYYIIKLYYYIVTLIYILRL